MLKDTELPYNSTGYSSILTNSDYVNNQYPQLRRSITTTSVLLNTQEDIVSSNFVTPDANADSSHSRHLTRYRGILLLKPQFLELPITRAKSLFSCSQTLQFTDFSFPLYLYSYGLGSTVYYMLQTRDVQVPKKERKRKRSCQVCSSLKSFRKSLKQVQALRD